MWVFDGEQWTDEGAEERKHVDTMIPVRIEQFVPELQVIEVVPLPRTKQYPPFPLP